MRAPSPIGAPHFEEHLVEHLVAKGQPAEALDGFLERQCRISRAEQEPVLQITVRGLDVELTAGQKQVHIRRYPNVGAAEGDTQDLGDPGPAAMRGDDLQLRVPGGEPVDLHRMAEHQIGSGIAPRHQQHRHSGVLAIPENRREGWIIGVFRVVGATALDDNALETLVLKNAADLGAGRGHIGGVDAAIADEAIRVARDQLGNRRVADPAQPPARHSARDDPQRDAGNRHLGKTLR